MKKPERNIKMNKKVQKKKLPAKKVLKKTIARKPAKSNNNTQSALAIVPYADIVQVELFENKLNGRDLHLMKSVFGEKVINFINRQTPSQYVLQKPGKGGKKAFDYIPGWYARKCANYAFGFNHSFEIKAKEILGLTAVVEGRFIVTDPKTGKEIMHKDDIGGHEIQFLSGKDKTPANAVNLANDYKSAVTDCLKRCMAQIGFFADVYGVNEAKTDTETYVQKEVYQEPVIQVNPKYQSPARKVENQATPVNLQDYLGRLNKRLEDLGYKTDAKKAEFISVKSNILMTASKFSKLTQKEAQMIIAVLAKLTASKK